MEIGSLEYAVIGFENNQFTSEILPELNAIQRRGDIRVVDLLFVQKEADGKMTVQEVNELNEAQTSSGFVDDLMELFTAEDIEQLVGSVPPGTLGAAHHWGQMCLFEGKNGLGFEAFTKKQKANCENIEIFFLFFVTRYRGVLGRLVLMVRTRHVWPFQQGALL